MRKDRALLVSLAVLFLAVAAYALRETAGAGWMPGCFFRKITGLECPGCGMTRASYALLHGRFMDAFLFNPVGMIVFPLALIGLSLEALAWVMNRPPVLRLNPGRWGATILVAVMILWWIGRNIF
jgi:hypothetical protein